MTDRLKIGIWGAGRRMQDYYAPIFDHLKEKYEVVGFWNRNPDKAKMVVDKFGFKHFSDEKELAEKSDALVVVVNSGAIEQVTLSLIDFGKPIFVETPIWSKAVPEHARHKNVSVAVAEQTAFLPSEQFKMLLLEKAYEFLGYPHIVMNDCRTFEYHGLAQLRRYIGFSKRPITIQGTSHSMQVPPYLDGNSNLQHHVENWDFGTIKFESGQVAVYNFSSIGNRCKFRRPRSLRIYCEKGTISNDDNDISLHILQKDGSTLNLTVEVEGGKDKTRFIRVELPGQEKYIQWRPSSDVLNDHQEAIEHLLSNFKDHVQKGNPLIYDAQQGWNDFRLLMAIRQSAQSGQTLRVG
jgi:predicted dehydrogenase